MKTLHHLFLDEMADRYDAEHQLLKALPKFAGQSSCSYLKETLLSHWEETKGHIAKLEQIFSSFHKKARGRTCEATMALLREADGVLSSFIDSPAFNAALISVTQKVEHHAIA